MTISSMTGFGRAAGTVGAWSYLWEVRSVNGKGLDVRLRLPNGLDTVEQQVRALAAKHLKRGNVQMSLQLDCEEQGSELRINQAALAAAITAGTAGVRCGGRGGVGRRGTCHARRCGNRFCRC
jgi:uncharacterized protein (TIGR00255 family)